MKTVINLLYNIENPRDFDLDMTFDVSVQVTIVGGREDVTIKEVKCTEVSTNFDCASELRNSRPPSELENYILTRWFRTYYLAEGNNLEELEDKAVLAAEEELYGIGCRSVSG